MMEASILYKKLTILIVHACLGIWLESVVSHSYHYPGRPHDCKIAISDVVENSLICLYASFVSLVISLINE